MAGMNPLLISMASSQEDKQNMQQTRMRNLWAPMSVTMADCDNLWRLTISALCLPNLMYFLLLVFIQKYINKVILENCPALVNLI